VLKTFCFCICVLFALGFNFYILNMGICWIVSKGQNDVVALSIFMNTKIWGADLPSDAHLAISIGPINQSCNISPNN